MKMETVDEEAIFKEAGTPPQLKKELVPWAYDVLIKLFDNKMVERIPSSKKVVRTQLKNTEGLKKFARVIWDLGEDSATITKASIYMSRDAGILPKAVNTFFEFETEEEAQVAHRHLKNKEEVGFACNAKILSEDVDKKTFIFEVGYHVKIHSAKAVTEEYNGRLAVIKAKVPAEGKEPAKWKLEIKTADFPYKPCGEFFEIEDKYLTRIHYQKPRIRSGKDNKGWKVGEKRPNTWGRGRRGGRGRGPMMMPVQMMPMMQMPMGMPMMNPMMMGGMGGGGGGGGNNMVMMPKGMAQKMISLAMNNMQKMQRMQGGMGIVRGNALCGDAQEALQNMQMSQKWAGGGMKRPGRGRGGWGPNRKKSKNNSSHIW